MIPESSEHSLFWLGRLTICSSLLMFIFTTLSIKSYLFFLLCFTVFCHLHNYFLLVTIDHQITQSLDSNSISAICFKFASWQSIFEWFLGTFSIILVYVFFTLRTCFIAYHKRLPSHCSVEDVLKVVTSWYQMRW